MKFGKVLEIRRVTLDMTQQEVADAVGVNVSTYGRWERGDNKPMKALHKILAEVLKFDELIVEEVQNEEE